MLSWPAHQLLAASSKRRADQPYVQVTSPVAELLQVIEVLDTMRKRLEALNGPDVPRI